MFTRNRMVPDPKLEAAYRRLAQRFGEDEADRQVALEKIRKIDQDPQRLIRGAEAEKFLALLVN